jgi:hypothetical protein
MSFEDLHPKSKEYIEALTTNVIAGTHKPDVIRYSGDVSDPRSRIVQPPIGSGEEFIILMEGYSAGDAFNRLIVKGLLQGSWVTSDTWEGTVTDTAIETAKAG